MARQARSEATRRRIIDSAVGLFNEIGYATTSLGDIIERAEMTKGALYYHFDSKEALGTAIIEEGSAILFREFARIRESSAPALERIIHSSFVIVGLLNTDAIARSSIHLMRAFGEFHTVAASAYSRWLDEIISDAVEAIEDGDLRAELDPSAVAETILGTMVGAELLSTIMASGVNVVERLGRVWEILLPALVTDESLSYFQQYLARESMRQSAPPLEP
ncbi:TetR family transcriptional regulator [Mycolicibacterium novocastrense]|uniref:ScbR family autoregulator-binding transcription factor n=1 Tax=Mycolicibacterium novocastrense TaxID=59813 RepID=UPI000749AC76|nr:ScbR family autoregulator-binding transcription factor [Mycolicibacterium novocastrense]KUH64242.1 TetR family transcriptional regulator [Mycolicibacterium novocastrense]KUH71224.1 TetR family transcriptional regulator [Mycolicibacterium novocastrense]KUH74532.1 TetR family transcriptional regulator [Mycolicibacterium novocastrense]